MRPVELELSGFTAYRDEAIIDFRDADLFALTGPTGSGKSSVVDAIVFALYGSVPRYDDRRAVEPVVTLGKNEARIRFDFTVGDDGYRVARVVRRTKNGATTAEARLEHDGVVLASGADDVTKKVEDLLGLAYEHFIKAVVLPQGEFARFLHDTRTKRHELLRELLDLDVYLTIRELANKRKSEADRLLAGHQREADLLADEAGRDEEVAARRVAELERLQDTVKEVRKQLALVDERLKETAKQITAQEHAVSLLTMRPPDGLGELVDRIFAADSAVGAAKSLAATTAETLRLHEEATAELPNPATLELQLTQQRDLERLLLRHERATALLTTSESDVEQRRHALHEAEEARSKAMETLEQLRRAHAAHELASTLLVGQPCPVCGVPVAELPEVEPIADIEGAEADVERRTADLDAARRALGEAERAASGSRAAVDEISSQVSRLRTGLDGVPAVGALTKALEAATAAGRRLVELKESASAVAEQLRTAEQRREALAKDEAEALTDFHAVRDKVAYLEPPPVTDDLAAAWASLTEWAAARSLEVNGQLDAIRAEAEQLADQRSRLTDDLETHLGGIGEDVTPEEAVFSARKDLDAVRTAKQRTKELAADIAAEKERSSVAATLTRHLRSNQFESWILEEALVDLTVGANQLLDELSSGAYSLQIDKGGFTVVDHRNADQHRSVRTLSGGESFLVSLALALSLSEQLTRMTSQGKLESIFLDEGFGTLDQETLDVAASVVQQLAARGLTVGLISHVTDLAEQVPTRFVVTKDVGGAHVKRVDA